MKAPLSQVQMRPAAGIDTSRRVSYYILRQDAMRARCAEMKSCYLIRHGKPDFPGGERMCLGRTDLPLSAVGRMEAALLAEYFPRRDLVLFSSPLRRAAETAAQFARPVSVLPGLAEMDAGEWDGLSFTEIRSRWPELYARRAHERVPPPGGESEAAALGRFAAAMGEVLKAGLAAKPELVKPNEVELGRMLGRELDTTDKIVEAARELQDQGISQVMVSMGSEGAVYVTAAGAWRLRQPAVEVVSTVGAGDSVVAALAYALDAGMEPIDAARLAMATGAATVMRPGTEPARPEDIDALLPQVDVEEL